MEIDAATMSSATPVNTDVVIIGSGLAGLVVALHLLDAASSSSAPMNIMILEKEAKVGTGNSIKASSGINGCSSSSSPDELSLFRQDTLESAGGSARPHLIEPLVTESSGAIAWLRERWQVDLSQKAQLGGHSAERTHRPGGPKPVGAEIMGRLGKAVQAAADKDPSDTTSPNSSVTLLTHAKVSKVLTSSDGRITGVEYEDLKSCDSNGGSSSPGVISVMAKHVVLATGGFSADRSLLARYRPELAKFPATQGPFSTGDGIHLATRLQANTVDMDKIQVHPTGFVDPKDPSNPSKFLAAEVLRGIGGILLDKKGQRFCDELGRRDYVTDRVLAREPKYAETKQWKDSLKLPTVHIALSVQAAASAAKHIEFYSWKGFLVKVKGSKGLAKAIGCPEEEVRKTLQEYQQASQAGKDSFGKTRFPSVPDAEEEFYVGQVTPVLHYCLGGVKIDEQGRVLDKEDKPIPGLYACGEVSGGVHGDNRLAGNSLLECVVFGRRVGQNILAQ